VTNCHDDLSLSYCHDVLSLIYLRTIVVVCYSVYIYIINDDSYLVCIIVKGEMLFTQYNNEYDMIIYIVNEYDNEIVIYSYE